MVEKPCHATSAERYITVRHLATSPVSPEEGPASGSASTTSDVVTDDAATSKRARRRQETARLLAEAHPLEGEARAALHDEAIRLNMQVAFEIAQRYHSRGIDSDDINQVACLGLTKAVRSFDPTVGTDFLSFAVPTIRGEIRRYFRDFGWTVRPPRWLQELQPRLVAAEAELFQQLGRSPRPSELAQHLDVELDRVLDALSANGCFSPASLDAPYGEGEASPADRLGVVEAAFGSVEARVALKPLLASLSDRERRILELRFGAGLTQAEIGAEIGVTQMQISRLLTRLLTKMRKTLESDAA